MQPKQPAKEALPAVTLEVKPDRASICGGVVLEVKLHWQAHWCSDGNRFFISFEGSQLRHVAPACLSRTAPHSLLLLVSAPKHDRAETVHVRAWARPPEGQAYPLGPVAVPFLYLEDGANRTTSGLPSNDVDESDHHLLDSQLTADPQDTSEVPGWTREFLPGDEAGTPLGSCPGPWQMSSHPPSVPNGACPLGQGLQDVAPHGSHRGSARHAARLRDQSRESRIGEQPVVTTDPRWSVRDIVQDVALLERLLDRRDPNEPRLLERSVALVHSLQDTVAGFRVLRKPHAVDSGNRLSNSCPSIPANVAAALGSGGCHPGPGQTATVSSCSALDGRRLLLQQRQQSTGTDDEWMPSEVKIRVNDITPASSQEILLQGTTGSSCPSSRRSSGASLASEDLAGVTEPCSEGFTRNEGLPRRQSWSALTQEGNRTASPRLPLQRSVSLNSLDSETEEVVCGSIQVDSHSDSLEGLTVRQRSRSASSGEAVALCSSQGCSLDEASGKEDHHRAGYRSPKLGRIILSAPHAQLLKSISTPSIVAAQQQEPQGKGVRHRVISRFAHSGEQWSAAQLVRSSVLVPEEEDEPEGQPFPFSLAAILREGHFSNVADSDDEKPFGKRKKRGSLFFRKRKGREKDVHKSAHQFVCVSYDTSVQCHACGKALASKPALKCDICLVTVHDSGCKDQVMDCTKLKSHKAVTKPSQLPARDRSSIPVGLHLPGRAPHYPNRYRHLVGPISQSMVHLAASSKTIPGTTRERKLSNTRNQVECSYSNAPSPSSSATAAPAASSCPNKGHNEDVDTPDETPTNMTETNSGSMESLEEGAQELSDLEDDPILRLTEEEPEAWSATADSKVLKKLKDKDIKRQEAIYELIITEKHHCLTLKIMQKVFAEGMVKELCMGKDLVEKMFPSLDELLTIHLAFLKRLRQKQMQDAVVGGIGDVLLSEFQGESAEKFRAVYGHFCSQHKEAVALYKDILKTDKKFQLFVRKCSLRPLCKTRGIPECILLVTQRVTKYPLLIDSLIKATKDNKMERESLEQAQALVKEIINQVDAQVHLEERKQRLLDIYNKVDAKSTAYYRGRKFKKSDFLSNSRKLRYEGSVCLKNARGKQLDVVVVVLSDVVFFLQENNQKYMFATFDNKSTVISLQKLLLRERAGQQSRGIYLISSQPDEPEMYELICSSPREKRLWMQVLREAVEACPENDEDVPSETEEEKKVEEARAAKLKELSLLLHEKDRTLVQVWEEKMQVLMEMLETIGVEQDVIDNMNPAQFKYGKLLEMDIDEAKHLMLHAASEVGRLAHNLYTSGSSNLSRSVSSAGEHQSDHYVPPLLPKRAETFAGFDQASKALKKRLSMLGENMLTSQPKCDKAESEVSKEAPDPHLQVKGTELRRSSSPFPIKPSSRPQSPERTHRRSIAGLEGLSPSGSTFVASTFPSSTPLLLAQGKEQLTAIVQLTHQLHSVMCLYSHSMSLAERLRSEVTQLQERLGSGRRKGHQQPQQRLEELRNLQEQLSQERAQWQRQCQEQQARLDAQQQEVTLMQEQVKREAADVAEQRESLFRQLEALQHKDNGGPKSPSSTPDPTCTPSVSSTASFQQRGGGVRRPAPSRPSVADVQQVLPLKLASSSSTGSSRGKQPRRSHSATGPLPGGGPVHVRAGSSPAKVHYTPATRRHDVRPQKKEVPAQEEDQEIFC